MTKKRNPINLDKLKRESGVTLESMLVELTGDSAKRISKPLRTRRFIASGKAHMS